MMNQEREWCFDSKERIVDVDIEGIPIPHGFGKLEDEDDQLFDQEVTPNEET